MVFKGIFFASPLTSHYTSIKMVEGNYISYKTYCTLLHIVNISMVVAERGERTSDCLVVSILNCIFCNCIVGILAIIFSVKARDDFDEGKTLGCKLL